MAITDSYATVEDYRALAGRLDGAQDETIKDDLDAVSRYMEGCLHRFFTNDAAVVNRIYVPRQTSRCMYIDDIATTTGLVIKVDTDRDGVFTDEDAWAATDYELWPRNADKGPEPQPWDELVIPMYSTKYAFAAGYPVQVTARFGWPSVPSAIKRSCIELTRILRLESPRASNRFNDMGEVLMSTRRARDIIEDLTKAYGRAVFA